MSGGYVKIARGIFKHNMFKDEPFTEREGDYDFTYTYNFTKG